MTSNTLSKILILINIFINLIMSGKREASYTIDPHTLEEKDKHQDPPSQS